MNVQYILDDKEIGILRKQVKELSESIGLIDELFEKGNHQIDKDGVISLVTDLCELKLIIANLKHTEITTLKTMCDIRLLLISILSSLNCMSNEFSTEIVAYNYVVRRVVGNISKVLKIELP